MLTVPPPHIPTFWKGELGGPALLSIAAHRADMAFKLLPTPKRL